MTMSQQLIDKEQINDPRHWRLALRVGDHRLHIVAYDSSQDNSLIYRHLPVNGDTSEARLKSLEEAVYDIPALLLDFGRVDVVVESRAFVVLPEALGDAENAGLALESLFPKSEGETVMSSLQGLGAVIASRVDGGVASFLRRTFNNPRFHHHLSPLCRYFHHKSRLGNTGKMYANLRDGAMDVIAFGGSGLILANTFPIDAPEDALYYILACRGQLGAADVGEELFLAGDKAMREALTPMLREYIAYVMPVIFPSELFRMGREAMEAPFDLIILPLCE